MPNISSAARTHAQSLLDFIDASPSPWHVVDNAKTELSAQGFVELVEGERWQIKPGGRYFVTRSGSSLIAFVIGLGAPAEHGLRIIGAHTDSPGLRLKPHAPHAADGMLRLGVEIYGGPILATFTDRDLGLAGRVNVRDGATFQTRLLKIATPLARLPNLAIHMNREVNESGLKLNKQTELPLLLGNLSADLDASGQFRQTLGKALNVAGQDVINWELAAFDTQKGSFWGVDQEFIADSQLDNLASCHAALKALQATKSPQATAIVALFDHEEVGSESAVGAGGNFMGDVLTRIYSLLDLDSEARSCTQARSLFISADMAHAWHPNFPSAYEPCHKAMVNAGPVIKTNANQRYATGADTAARFMSLCAAADVPFQQYSHRSDLGCGSTIGPIVAARLGMPTLDVGCPMWAMHSLRESAGVMDQHYMFLVMRQHFAG